MSWVSSSEGTSALQRLRGALIDEIGATRLYDELSEAFPEHKEVLQEIKRDEVNHQGRLLDLIMKIDPSQVDSFNAGLEQKE